jgi:hypothetical protein
VVVLIADRVIVHGPDEISATEISLGRQRRKGCRESIKTEILLLFSLSNLNQFSMLRKEKPIRI